MKKIILLSLVAMLVLGAATYVYAASSALINAGGPHNMQVQMNLGASEELCAYCHTPHDADIVSGLVPLGNISAATATEFCDTCHGGLGVANGDFKHGGSGVALTGWGAGSIAATATITDWATTGGVDHVVNISYPLAADTNFRLQAAAETTLYGAPNGKLATVECTACHAVHNNADGLAPFLRIANSGSAMCLACHNR